MIENYHFPALRLPYFYGVAFSDLMLLIILFVQIRMIFPNFTFYDFSVKGDTYLSKADQLLCLLPDLDITLFCLFSS